MSGIFDVLRTALKRPDNDRIDHEERDVHSDGEVNQVSSFSLPSHFLLTSFTLPSHLLIPLLTLTDM
jgi:hypothetical protein